MYRVTEPFMTSNLFGKWCFPTQHVTHDLAEKRRWLETIFNLFEHRDQGYHIYLYFQMEENLKEAVVKPVLLSSSSTSLPIRSLNVVGDCVLLCGGLPTLCLACAKTHTLSWERGKKLLWNYYGKVQGIMCLTHKEITR